MDKQSEKEPVVHNAPLKCGCCKRAEYKGKLYIWCPELVDWRLSEQRCEWKRPANQ